MQEHDFDEILDFLCSGIMSKSERQNVRDELYDHLMCRYETNLAVGMDEEKAAESAINNLGDKNTLRFKLSQVHSYAPKPTMKKAMNLLIFGYVLNSFHISFFEGMNEITTFIGTVCFIVALFCLRTANKKLKAAFYLKTLSAVLSWVIYAVDPIYSLPFTFRAVIGVMTNLINPVYIILMILGLKELVMPHFGDYPKKIPFDAGVLLNGMWGIINIVLYVLLIDSGELNTNLESIFLFALIVISVILNLFILVRSSKLLWNSDHEYKIEDSFAKKTVAALLAVAVAILPTVAVDISLANQKAETSSYSFDDSEMPYIEYERICSNLISYGIPEKIVYNLPETEILKYSDCINKNDLKDEILKYLGDPCYSCETGICNDVNAVFSACAVGMTDSDGYPYVRVLSWVDYRSTGKGYDDALFWGYLPSKFILYNSYEAYEGDLLLILSEENGKILKNEPLDIYTDKDGLTERMSGVRFESKENLTIIHAETFGLAQRDEVTYSNYYFELAHRTSPFTLFYRSPVSAKENNARQNGIGYLMHYENTEIVWCATDSEEK